MPIIKKLERGLKDRIKNLGKWYYYLNFDGVQVGRNFKGDKAGGYSNWNNYLKHCIPDTKNMRILDAGCNAGIYDLEMAKNGAREIIGVDLNVEQALFVKDFFSEKLPVDFKNVSFIHRDIAEEGLSDLGIFDFACLFCVVYHFREKIDFVMDEISSVTKMLVMQGNLNRLNSPKYKERIGTEYAGIEGMKALLKRHGFRKLQIFAFGNYPKPVVIGEK